LDLIQPIKEPLLINGFFNLTNKGQKMKKDNKTLSGKKPNKKKDIQKINNWLDTMNIKDESNTLADIFYSGLTKNNSK
tara:strand:- start:5704 stop:5937 length:234 start_codon:yes stop_codon:yes gene_type:complete